MDKNDEVGRSIMLMLEDKGVGLSQELINKVMKLPNEIIYKLVITPQSHLKSDIEKYFGK